MHACYPCGKELITNQKDLKSLRKDLVDLLWLEYLFCLFPHSVPQYVRQY